MLLPRLLTHPACLVVRLQHYRSRCGEDKAECAELHDVVRDTAIARYRRVLRAVRRVLRVLDIAMPFQSRDHLPPVNTA